MRCVAGGAAVFRCLAPDGAKTNDMPPIGFLYANDDQLVKALLANNEAAIDYVFYNKFHKLLLLNAAKATGSKDMVPDDLIQDLYLYLSADNWARLRNYDSSYPFVAWFSTVSYRFFRNCSRKVLDSKRCVSIYDLKGQDLQVSVGENGMVIEDVRTAIDRLESPRDRQLLTEMLFNGAEADEVAAMLNVSVNNLYVIKRRALTKLIRYQLTGYQK